MTSVQVTQRIRGEKLASASTELFEVGDLEAGPLDPKFARRLNTMVVRRQVDMVRNVPSTLADAINAKGVLKKQAELVVFGNWLTKGSPGAESRPGKPADPKKILKCVGAILSEMKTAERKKRHAQPARGRKTRMREITKKDVAEQWKILFDEKVAASSFDAPLRSARHILSDYLRHLKSGSELHSGKPIKKSPEIERALDAITGLLPAKQTIFQEIFVEPDSPRPATLAPFEIALEYQSDAHAEEYRRLPSGTKLNPQLRYVPHKTAPTSLSGNARADRKGTITLMPDVNIRGDYQVKALIDSLAILASTTAETDEKTLKKQIEKTTGKSTFVRDLTKIKNENGWGTPLPLQDLSKLTGHHFAVMIQEPTPEVLAAILKAIKVGPGLIEPVLFHLIEVSVDFYPRKPCTTEEALLRRERMVGLLQRHHWTSPSRSLEPGSTTPRHADARQLSEKEIEYGEVVPKTAFLFAHVKSSGGFYRNESDALVIDPEIRNRILTKKPGSTLHLNSTIAKGGKFAPHMVSVQHKISDRRNLGKNTFTSLSDEERRARIEVTISGTETLNKHGLQTIDDLSSISFRKITKDFLRCRLPMIEPLQHIFEDAKAQMKNRGVYGINLRLRALGEERRLAAKRDRGKSPRRRNAEEIGLADWKEMNAVIGYALDGLQRRWSGFKIK
ncbi:hypothetical protein [Roseovarius confluentis]|uniref:hypothetical protein n=1 Tax=Roseovarius confluentis TaxID=1852027 RepID=UPI000CDD2FD0|nr:hypothetical protein [Roseovarius confluentis]